MRLFERHARGVKLTPAGKAALPLAEETLARAQDIQRRSARWRWGAAVSCVWASSVRRPAAQVHTVLALVDQGLGVALVPSALQNASPGRVRFVSLSSRGAPIEVGLSLVERPRETSRLLANFRAVALAAQTER